MGCGGGVVGCGGGVVGCGGGGKVEGTFPRRAHLSSTHHRTRPT